MAKQFLYLTNDKMVALVWNRGAIVGREIFAAGDAGSAELAGYLAKQQRTPTWVVTDLIEEDFRLDTVPHLRGADQVAVLGRKLGQVYRSSVYRHAIIQGREEEGRRDDKVLLHAITNPDLLKPWLDALERASVPLEGAFSSPVLSGRLLKDLDVFFPHTLLVTIVPDFGLRQTYFQNKQVKFSRLTPIVYDENRSVGALIAAETSRTWQYLDSLRYFSGEDTLEVCILVHDNDRELIAEAIRTFPLLKYRFLDISEVANKIGLKPAPTSSHSEEVLVHLYAQTGAENHFVESTQTRFATFRRARIGLFAATAGIVLAGAAWAGFNLYEAAGISSEIERRELIQRGITGEYQAVSDSMRRQTLASDTVHDATTFFNSQIRPLPSAPGAMLRSLAEAIAEFPDVRLLQVVWATANEDAGLPYFSPLGASGEGDVRSEARGPAPSAATVIATAFAGPGPGLAATAQALADPNPPLRGNKFQIGILEGTITPFSGDFRGAIERVRLLNDRLNQLPGVKSRIVSLPIDSGPQSAIVARGGTHGVGDAVFVIRVVKAVEP
jgi:hypothetical protein